MGCHGLDLMQSSIVRMKTVMQIGCTQCHVIAESSRLGPGKVWLPANPVCQFHFFFSLITAGARSPSHLCSG